MKLIYVCPADGMLVLDERTGKPYPGRVEVPDTPYVRRRLIAGDLVSSPHPTDTAAKKPTAQET